VVPSAFLTPDEDDDAPVNDEDEPVPVLVIRHLAAYQRKSTLLIWWDTFLILDLLLDIVDAVSGFDFKRNSLSG